MSATTTRTDAKSRGSRSVVGGSLPTRPRRLGIVFYGLTLMLLCAGGGALLMLNAGDRVTVLAVRDGVPAGHVIDQDNLISKQVAGLEDALTASDFDQVVGKQATVALVPGQVLTRALVGGSPIPAEGEALAGVALTASQMPGAGLAPGDMVRVLAVPAPEAGGVAGLDETVVLSRSARVFDITGGAEGEATRVVTLVVNAGEADAIATYAASKRIAIVKLAAGGR